MYNYYKDFGLKKGMDDQFLTTLGTCKNVVDGVSRFVWGLLNDKFTFK
jgi:hypothetical protein